MLTTCYFTITLNVLFELLSHVRSSKTLPLAASLILLKLLYPGGFYVVLCSHASLVLQWVSSHLWRRRILHYERRFEPWFLRHSNDSGYADSNVCRHGNAFLTLKLIVIYFQLAMSLTLWTHRCWNGLTTTEQLWTAFTLYSKYHLAEHWFDYCRCAWVHFAA